MSFGGGGSVPKPKPSPATPREASYISRGSSGESRGGLPLARPKTPVIGRSISNTGTSLLGGG